MTEAEAAIADLDQALAEFGEDAQLQRATGTGANQVVFAVTCRVRRVRDDAQTKERGDYIAANNALFVISPSEIERRQWPGPQALPARPGDRRVPRNGDRLVLRDEPWVIEMATPFYLAGALVRLEITCRSPWQ